MLEDINKENGGVIYVPSPVNVLYNYVYTIEVNKSGRLQYFRQPVNRKRKRITRSEFAKIYNTKKILAIDPIQHSDIKTNHFLLKFYTI